MSPEKFCFCTKLSSHLLITVDCVEQQRGVSTINLFILTSLWTNINDTSF